MDSRYEPRQIGNTLKGKLKDIYIELADYIRKTAAGEISATEFVLKTDMNDLTSVDTAPLLNAILVDFLYELY